MPFSLGNDNERPGTQVESLRMTVANDMECGRSVDNLNDLIALRVPLPYPAAGKLGDENGAVPIRHQARQGAVILSLCCRCLRRPALHVELRKFGIQVNDCQHHPSPSLNPRHPHRKQRNWNWRSLLLVGSILGITTPVLSIQPDIGKKPIAEGVQAVVLRSFVFPVPTTVQN
jgi:hypothetical protein